MTGVPHTYDKSFNMVPAAALLNLELGGGGWFDITAYTGHTIRFHCENYCPNGGTIDGNVIANTFGDYKADPGNFDLTPSNIVMIDPYENGATGKIGTNIAQVINGPNGFGNLPGWNTPLIAIAYDDNFGEISPIAYNFNDTAYSISNSDWQTIVTHLENNSTSQPTGDGFVNTDLNSGVNSRIKILLIQNNPVKVNNTDTNQYLYNQSPVQPAIPDGNLPITYGQPSNGDLLFTGENPTAFVGGKCEMIKTHLPLRTLDGFYNQNEGGLIRQPRNIVKSDGTTPVGVLNSGVAYNGYINQFGTTDSIGLSQVRETTHIRNGATWSAMSPDD